MESEDLEMEDEVLVIKCSTLLSGKRMDDLWHSILEQKKLGSYFYRLE